MCGNFVGLVDVHKQPQWFYNSGRRKVDVAAEGGRRSQRYLLYEGSPVSRTGNIAQTGTANLRPWRKGQSGNPKGRRALPNIREALVFLTSTDERLAAGRCICSSLAARRGIPPHCLRRRSGEASQRQPFVRCGATFVDAGRSSSQGRARSRRIGAGAVSDPADAPSAS